MATKVILGKRPKSFQHTVRFMSLVGEVLELGVTYKYRTKREFGTLIDETFGPAKPKAGEVDLLGDSVKVSSDPAPVPTVAESIDMGTEANADYILKIAEGWDIGEPFTRAKLIELGNEQPRALIAVMEDYRTAIIEGRLGN